MVERIAIVPVLPGAASLGAYQAGTMAAVVSGVGHLRGRGLDLTIPVIGGASAGATVALLAGHALAHGLNAVALLEAAWVDGVDIDLLSSGDDAPLGHGGLRRAFSDLLMGDRGRFAPLHALEHTDVTLHIALTSLAGYRYPLSNMGDRPVTAVTYVDWVDTTYPAGGDPEQLCSPPGESFLDAVLASIANPAVFPPVVLPERFSGNPLRRHGGVDPSGATEAWWFVDGAMVQSRPIRRTVDLAGSERPIRCIVVDPRSEAPSTGFEWLDSDRDPDWVGAFMRSLAILPAQVVSDDLRRLDEENLAATRLAALAEFLSVSDRAGFERWWSVIADGEPPGHLGDVLVAAAGLPGARTVDVDVIRPALVADAPVDRLLSGELLGDFGGFLDEDLRRSDFALGFAAATRWWSQLLDELGVDEAGSLEDHLDEVGPPAWRQIERGQTELAELEPMSKVRLARLLARAVRAAMGG